MKASYFTRLVALASSLSLLGCLRAGDPTPDRDSGQTYDWGQMAWRLERAEGGDTLLNAKMQLHVDGSKEIIQIRLEKTEGGVCQVTLINQERISSKDLEASGLVVEGLSDGRWYATLVEPKQSALPCQLPKVAETVVTLEDFEKFTRSDSDLLIGVGIYLTGPEQAKRVTELSSPLNLGTRTLAIRMMPKFGSLPLAALLDIETTTLSGFATSPDLLEHGSSPYIGEYSPSGEYLIYPLLLDAKDKWWSSQNLLVDCIHKNTGGLYWDTEASAGRDVPDQVMDNFLREAISQANSGDIMEACQ